MKREGSQIGYTDNNPTPKMEIGGLGMIFRSAEAAAASALMSTTIGSDRLADVEPVGLGDTGEIVSDGVDDGDEEMGELWSRSEEIRIQLK